MFDIGIAGPLANGWWGTAVFVLILAVGKRLPRGGSEIGITAVGTSFVLSCLTGIAWIQRVNAAEGGGGGEQGAGFDEGFGRGGGA